MLVRGAAGQVKLVRRARGAPTGMWAFGHCAGSQPKPSVSTGGGEFNFTWG